jgi:hypothetical protein
MIHSVSPCPDSSKMLMCTESHLNHNAFLLSLVSRKTSTGPPNLLGLVSPSDEVYFYRFCYESVVVFMSDYNNCGRRRSGLSWYMSAQDELNETTETPTEIKNLRTGPVGYEALLLTMCTLTSFYDQLALGYRCVALNTCIAYCTYTLSALLNTD